MTTALPSPSPAWVVSDAKTGEPDASIEARGTRAALAVGPADVARLAARAQPSGGPPGDDRDVPAGRPRPPEGDGLGGRSRPDPGERPPVALASAAAPAPRTPGLGVAPAGHRAGDAGVPPREEGARLPAGAPEGRNFPVSGATARGSPSTSRRQVASVDNPAWFTGSRDTPSGRGGFQPFLPHPVQPAPVGAQAGRTQGARTACSRQERGVAVSSDSSEPPTGSPHRLQGEPRPRTAHLAPEAASG
jgi:hypothetical protein